MSRPFAAVESFLERILERPAARLFHAHPQPIHLERRIERVMVSQRMVKGGHAYVPSRYRIILHPSDLEALEAAGDGLATELAEAIVQRARSQGYWLVTRPEVRLLSSPRVPQGELEVEAEPLDATLVESAAAGLRPVELEGPRAPRPPMPGTGVIPDPVDALGPVADLDLTLTPTPPVVLEAPGLAVVSEAPAAVPMDAPGPKAPDSRARRPRSPKGAASGGDGAPLAAEPVLAPELAVPPDVVYVPPPPDATAAPAQAVMPPDAVAVAAPVPTTGASPKPVAEPKATIPSSPTPPARPVRPATSAKAVAAPRPVTPAKTATPSGATTPPGSGEPAKPVLAPPPPAPVAVRAIIEVQVPDEPLRRVRFEGGSLRVGRGADNEIALSDARVSRHHGRFTARHGVLVYTDLESTNGSLINGVRVPEAGVGVGDVVRVGRTTLTVRPSP